MSQQIWLKVTKTNGMFSIQVVDKLGIIATLPLVWKSYICQTVTMSHQFFQIFGQDDGFQIAKALLENAISIESDAETKTYLESRLAELLREIAERQKPRIPKVEKILKIWPGPFVPFRRINRGYIRHQRFDIPHPSDHLPDRDLIDDFIRMRVKGFIPLPPSGK